MIVYGIPNCNTVKKAQDWLKNNNIDFKFHNFKKEGITAEKLVEWFAEFGPEKVLNKAGLTFKKLTSEEKADINTPEKIIKYLIENTSAIKRPIVEQNGKAVLLGFDEQTYQNTVK